ncbi:hydroxylysine kinase-like [Aplysia californica]|uniref:Hydroxylysine kinase n=1 Tax=Aplysia californica TaxID=6500 RepID=A0ABM1VXY4_APLCA|nr:hydroxylysine kinase-like [Aplysia californica]
MENKVPTRPRLLVDDVPSLISEVYGLKVDVVKEMDSYDDRIFIVHALPGSSLPPQLSSICSSGYTFKVINAIDSLDENIIDAKTRITLHARMKGFPTPCPVLNLDREYQKLLNLLLNLSFVSENVTEKCVVRLFEFIAGTTLEKVPLTPTLCEEIGEFAARLDIALETFSHSDESALLKMVNKWNMSEIPRLRDVVHVIADEEQRSVVTEVITSFEQNVLTRQEEYTKGLIHGDFNDGNILVSETPTSATLNADVCKNTHLVGIIDFGDSTVSLYIFEVAIAIIYAMLNRNGVPPMEAGARILAGYLRHKTLSQMEIRHLKLCICARFAQSYTMSYHALSLNPENRYVINHAQRIWPQLSVMWRGSDEEILQQLTKYCNNGV